MYKAAITATASKQRSLGASLFAIAAALLVFNSHLETLYPWHFLAGDGLLGNSMFFFLSGWGLAKSWSASPTPFWTYAWKRVSRIYPALILAILLLSWLPAHGWNTWSFPKHIFEFIYPTHFTYINIIIPAYVLIYPLLRLNRPAYYFYLMLGAALIYTLAYLSRHDYLNHPHLSLGKVPAEFHYSYYSAVILNGMQLGAGHATKSSHRLKTSDIWAVALVSAYLFLKVLMAVSIGWKLFPLLHVLCFLSLSPLFGLANLLGTAISDRWVSQIVTFAGTLTLEIYVTHLLLLKRPEVMSTLPLFPLNILAFFLITLCASIALHYGARLITEILERSSRSRRSPSIGTPSEDPDRKCDSVSVKSRTKSI